MLLNFSKKANFENRKNMNLNYFAKVMERDRHKIFRGTSSRPVAAPPHDETVLTRKSFHTGSSIANEMRRPFIISPLWPS